MLSHSPTLDLLQEYQDLPLHERKVVKHTATCARTLRIYLVVPSTSPTPAPPNLLS